MKEITSNVSTIVILGAWNLAIFSNQDWVSKNVLSQYSKVKVAYPMNGVMSLRFETDHFAMYIVGERLVFERLSKEDVSCITMIEALTTISRLLAHTPVHAMGINFVFSTEGENILQSIDNTKELVDSIGHSLSSLEITRSFMISNQETLNLKISHKNGQNFFDFNFNYNVNSLAEVQNVITENDFILNKRQNVLEIMNSVYGESL